MNSFAPPNLLSLVMLSTMCLGKQTFLVRLLLWFFALLQSDNGDTLVLSGPTQRSIRNGEASVVKSLQEKNLCEQIRSYEFVVVLVFA